MQRVHARRTRVECERLFMPTLRRCPVPMILLLRADVHLGHASVRRHHPRGDSWIHEILFDSARAHDRAGCVHGNQNTLVLHSRDRGDLRRLRVEQCARRGRHGLVCVGKGENVRACVTKSQSEKIAFILPTPVTCNNNA